MKATYNKSKIMRNAWYLKKAHPAMIFSTSLRKDWHTHEGYRVEMERAITDGNQAHAVFLEAQITEQKTLYMAAKAAIRAQYPDQE